MKVNTKLQLVEFQSAVSDIVMLQGGQSRDGGGKVQSQIIKLRKSYKLIELPYEV